MFNFNILYIVLGFPVRVTNIFKDIYFNYNIKSFNNRINQLIINITKKYNQLKNSLILLLYINNKTTYKFFLKK